MQNKNTVMSRIFKFFTLLILGGAGVAIILQYLREQSEQAAQPDMTKNRPETNQHIVLQDPAFSERPPIDSQPDNSSTPKPDDLTQIKGIGPKTAEVLNQHGIITFEDLAKSPVEALFAKLESVRGISTAKVDDWVKQAQELTA